MYMKKYIPISLYLFALFPLLLLAKVPTQKIVLISSLDSIIFPIIVSKEVDTSRPPKPHFTVSPPTVTSKNSVSVEIVGEANTQIIVNSRVVGTIGRTGKVMINLDTSGSSSMKYFTIVLKDSAGNTSESLVVSIEKKPTSPDEFSQTTYKGLNFYYEKMASTEYQLPQMSDEDFNALSATQKLQVAHTLLSTFFFGYSLETLQAKIDAGNFISTLQSALDEEMTDKGQLEESILDSAQATTILTRFYMMQHLDRYFVNNWIAYILTQTIMFSPANEILSTHTPDISNTYNRIVNMLAVNSGMRYMTYVHMMNQENWRRFRSPEDNGREMLEIYTLDNNDSHVPIAAKALQNWKLNQDSDTLEVSLNENREPLSLFGKIIYNGDDFYRELVKSEGFTYGVTLRLVEFFFPEKSQIKKERITSSIVQSKPESWRDILYQIVFSKEYLLHNSRAKSAEERFFSLSKIMEYKHNIKSFGNLKKNLEKMNQATMEYKLGKLERVPLDTLSFAYYHKYIREGVLLKISDTTKTDSYKSRYREGWSESFIADTHFSLDESDLDASLSSIVNYLFRTLISRDASQEELQLFKEHMFFEKNGNKLFVETFNIFSHPRQVERESALRKIHKKNIAIIVLDYLSRLEALYYQSEVK